MKTKKITTGKARNLLLALLMITTVSVFADGNKSSSCTKAENKIDSSQLSEMEKPSFATAALMSPAPAMAWMIEEVEEELKVEDLDVSYSARPLWNVEAKDTELKVEDYVPTEKVVPYWMIVENETELEVTDLVLN